MSKYVIIGNSTAGLAALQALLAHDPGALITVVSEERHLPYSRVLLTHLLAGKVQRCNLDLAGPNLYRQAGITLLQGQRAAQIDPGSKTVTLESGMELSYDKLLVSSGSSPVFPSGTTPEAPQVAGLRTLEDVDKIMNLAMPGDRVAVVGGGPVGVKLACALREAGALPEIIVSSAQLLSQVADDEAAAMVQNRMYSHRIRTRTGVDATALELSSCGKAMLLLSDGTELPCSLVIYCKGVRPNTSMFNKLIPAGRGLQVDRWMRTAFEDIYAAGDVAETYEITRRQYCVAATWPHAVLQGRLAGMNMAGCRAVYSGSLFRNAMEVFELPFVSVGIVRPPSGRDWDVRISRDGPNYRKLVYRGGALVGAQLVGDVGEAGALQAEIRRSAAQDQENNSIP